MTMQVVGAIVRFQRRVRAGDFEHAEADVMTTVTFDDGGDYEADITRCMLSTRNAVISGLRGRAGEDESSVEKKTAEKSKRASRRTAKRKEETPKDETETAETSVETPVVDEELTVEALQDLCGAVITKHKASGKITVATFKKLIADRFDAARVADVPAERRAELRKVIEALDDELSKDE